MGKFVSCPGPPVTGWVRAYPPTHRQPLRLLHTLDWTPTHPKSPCTRPTRRNDAFALVRRACGCRHQLLAVRLLRLLRFPKQRAKPPPHHPPPPSVPYCTAIRRTHPPTPFFLERDPPRDRGFRTRHEFSQIPRSHHTTTRTVPTPNNFGMGSKSPISREDSSRAHLSCGGSLISLISHECLCPAQAMSVKVFTLPKARVSCFHVRLLTQAQEHELRVEAEGNKTVFVTLRSGTGEIFGTPQRSGVKPWCLRLSQVARLQ